MAIASGIMMPLNSSGGVGIVKIIQVFDYLGFVDVESPDNLDAVLEMFNSNFLDLIPNFFANKEFDDDYDRPIKIESAAAA